MYAGTGRLQVRFAQDKGLEWASRGCIYNSGTGSGCIEHCHREKMFLDMPFGVLSEDSLAGEYK